MFDRLARLLSGSSASTRRCLASWVIRDWLDLRLIHYRLTSLVSSAGRNDPELGDLSGSSTRTRLDTTGIDALIVGQVELRIHSPLCREVRPLLTWIGRSNDDEARIRLTLQAQSNIVKYGLGSVVDAPWLRLIRELDLVDLARLRRWRRRWRWSLDRHSRLGVGAKVAIIRDSASHCDWTGLRALSIQRCIGSIRSQIAGAGLMLVG